MGEQQQRQLLTKGEEFERKAEKKLKGWSLSGSKYDDASDLYQKAANSYKLAKSWDRAATIYIKLANCQLKSGTKHEAARAYVDAANCYKKTSTKRTISCLDQAVVMFMEINRFNMAAKYCKEIGELCEQEKSYEQAMAYFERAADLFQSEEVPTSASLCKQKVAEFSALSGKYQKAIELYEEVARYSLKSNLLKYGARGHLLNAGICQLCKGDIVAINNAIDKYQDLDPTFSRTRECKLLLELAGAYDEEDVTKFTLAIREFDSITKLDTCRTTLLFRVKENLKAKELEDEDDLT